ncbi:MAG: phosphate-starvation-inducible PsiE family protein [Acidithiobacillus sp.]|nr:phosphate-starvation-inducible PsiE family protein [Acidithiobacillus sp.]
MPNLTQQKNQPYPWLFGNLRRRWPILDFYERFEQIIALILSFFLAIVIIIALWHLGIATYRLLVNINQAASFRSTISVFFDDVLGLLIAMEFNHTIFHTVTHRGQIVRVKTVVLIAILAMSRQFIVLENEPTTALRLIAFAFAVLFLGIVYYLMDKQDRLKQENGVTKDRLPARHYRKIQDNGPLLKLYSNRFRHGYLKENRER